MRIYIPAMLTDLHRFVHPYTQQPTWACSTSNATVASPHTPTPENAQTDVKDASTTPPVDASTITTMLSGNTQNDATELFRQALKPQDYRASSAFVQHVVQQLLETVDRRRPLSHLRSFVTPEILDNVEHFSAERNYALITLTGQSQTNPGIPALQPAPLRLLRLHLRARRLNPQESAEARAQERQLPPGYHAALRPGQQAKPSNAITAEADLRRADEEALRKTIRAKGEAKAALRAAAMSLAGPNEQGDLSSNQEEQQPVPRSRAQRRAAKRATRKKGNIRQK